MAEGNVEQSWEDVINIYKNPGAFLVSGTLFILYTILTLIDVNDIIKSYNVLDLGSTTRGTMVYSYISGYYIFVLKLLITILTVFVLVTIIRISVVVVLSLFKLRIQMQGGGATEIKRSYEGGSDDLIMAAVNSNFKLFLGFFTVPSMAYFIFIFLVLLPLLLFFAILAIVQFYDKPRIQSEVTESVHTASILNTNHHYLMFIISALITTALIYICIKFYFMLDSTGESI